MSLPFQETAAAAWQPPLPAEDRMTALRIAREVAGRLCVSEQVDTAVVAAQQQTTLPNSMAWPSHGVAQGYAGLALLCSYLDACLPDEHWDVVGHHYLSLAVRDIQDYRGLPLGVHAGLSGLALTAWLLSRQGKRYRTLLSGLDAILAEKVPPLASSIVGQYGVTEPHYDLISGLAGIGAYLLCRLDDPDLAATLHVVLRALIELAKEEEGLPHWHTPPQLLMDQRMRVAFPYGALNCGLAHGIPGPLGTLALARLVGIEVEGLAETIDALAGWLVTHRADDAWGINWPTAVAIPGADAASSADQRRTAGATGPSRAAWCYGSPGVARALWLSGRALDSSMYCDLAIEAMEAVYRKPIPARQIDSPTFCHGVAGLLHVTLRFAQDTGLPIFAEAAQALTTQLLSLYEPESLVGYRRFEPSEARVDNPGILDGAAGVVLVLLAVGTQVEPVWDRLFLIA